MQVGEVGEVCNIGSGFEKTNIEIALTVLNEVGAIEYLIKLVEDQPGHDQRYALDAKKIRDLGWKSEWSFKEGVPQTVRWHL